MKKITSILIQFLLIPLLAGVVVESVSANFKPYQPPLITINSPLPDRTYNSSNIPLNISIDFFGLFSWDSDNLTSVSYSLDEQNEVPLALTVINGGATYVNDNLMLMNLSNCAHSLRVSVVSTKNNERVQFNSTEIFTVNTPVLNNASNTIQPMDLNNPVLMLIVALIVFVILTVIITNTKKVGKKMKPIVSYGF